MEASSGNDFRSGVGVVSNGESEAQDASSSVVGVLEPPPGWGVEEPVSASVFAGMDEEVLLSELAKHERWTAWLVARGVAITEALTRSREQAAVERLEVEEPGASSRARNLARAEARAGMQDEVALATGVPVSVCRARSKLAAGDPVRYAAVRAALGVGELSWQRAWHLLRVTEEAPAEAIEGIVDRVTAPYPMRGPGGRGGLLVPQEVFTSRLRYAMARVTTPAERVEQGLENRCTSAVLTAENGTGEFTVSGHAARVVGAHERVDEIARRLRREGDARTLAQLRSDIALDLLLFGQLPTQAGLADGMGDEQTDPVGAYAPFSGALPPARVDVVVSLAALMGASQEPGSVACGGRQEWVAARWVREVAFTAGSTWRRLVTDPVTGHLVDLHVKGYQVGGDLRERVLARDRVSRVPGSMRPARSCDLDHDVDYALGGASCESNLSAKDRRGHNHKTRRTWRVRREPVVGGDIFWTTPAGRVYVTSPWDYRDPDPPTVAQMRADLARERRRYWTEDDLLDEEDASDPTPGGFSGSPPWSPGSALGGGAAWAGSACGGTAAGGVVDSGSSDATRAAPVERDENSADRSEAGSAPAHSIDAAQPDDIIDPADWGEDAWVLHDLDFTDPAATHAGRTGEATDATPSDDQPEATQWLYLDSDYERGLAALIEDAQDPQSLFIRPPKPTKKPKPEAGPTPWAERDPGPPPF